MNGAENLLGLGDMLFTARRKAGTLSGARLLRLRGGDRSVVVDFWRAKAAGRRPPPLATRRRRWNLPEDDGAGEAEDDAWTIP